MTEVVVRAIGVGKTYRIFDNPADRLRQMLSGRRSKHYRDFVALRDVSFEMRRGEAMGIIGRNGQGKSTLLQILAGTTSPTTGTVETSGRVAALLELGAGFNPEFSGRENILFNGVLQGMARAEVLSLLPQIVEFAEIDSYIDQPVKTYSTGMFVRLAFAAHVFQSPEILIVDEALSVGDVFFQQKCFEKIRAMRDNGLTLVFVSHDLAAVRNVCDRCLLLNAGAVVFEGPPDEAVSRFYNAARPVPVAKTERSASPTDSLRVPPDVRKMLVERNILHGAKPGHGEGGLAIEAVVYENELGEFSFSTLMQGTARIFLLLKASQDVQEPSAGMHLFDRMNNLVFGAGTRQRNVRLPSMRPGDEIAVAMDITLCVGPGEYTFNVGCSSPSLDGPNQGVNLDRREGLGPIVVHTELSRILPFYGIAELPFNVRVLG
jgi:lipopolysaccharide transport system ATP-binding protein